MYSNQVSELKETANKSEEVFKEQSASSLGLKSQDISPPLTLGRTSKLKSFNKSSLPHEYLPDQTDERPYQVKTFDEALEEVAKLGLNLDALLELYPTAEDIIKAVNHQLELNASSNSNTLNPNLLNTAHSLKVDVPEVLKMAQELGVSPNEALESAIMEIQTANYMNQKMPITDQKGPYKADFQTLKTDQRGLAIDVNVPNIFPKVDIDGLAPISTNQFSDLRQKELFQELLKQGTDSATAYAIAQAKFSPCIFDKSPPRSDVATDGEEEINLEEHTMQEDYFQKCTGSDKDLMDMDTSV